MTGVKILSTSICLVTSCAGLLFLGSATLPGAPQRVQGARTSLPSKRSKATKRTGHKAPMLTGHKATKPTGHKARMLTGHKATKPTWHSGPAASPLETEIVPSRPPAAPPQVSTTLNSSAKQKKSAAVNRQAAPLARSVRASTGTPAAAVVQTPTANAHQPDFSNSPDPEAQRIQDEFARLREDADARRAFYDDLLGTVERVRAGMRDENSAEEKPVSFQPAARPSGKTSLEPVNPPHLPEFIQPQEPPPAKPPTPQSSLGPSGNRIDRVAYQRVVRWAKANNVPVSLALGVAWMESHLNPNPPRGSAGEVGMFQIMPERCRLEGWPSKRLSEPEFNAWMGTMLLARYYQEEGSVARAAAKYVAGPGVFNKKYSEDMWAYINRYATTVDTYASYFSRGQS